MSLNTHSPIPLYQQLANRLRSNIDAQLFKVGGKIPSEHELAEQYHIGRPTVRQATDLLVRQGILQRRRGSGTYVFPAPKKVDLFSLAGTSAAFGQGAITVESELLGPVTKIDPQGIVPAALNMTSAYLMQRLNAVHREPVLLEKLYLNAAVFVDFDRLNLTQGSLAQTVKEAYHLVPTSADQTFNIVRPHGLLAVQMQLDKHQPSALLHVARTLHFDDYPGAIYSDIYCRTDKFEIPQTIYAPQSIV